MKQMISAAATAALLSMSHIGAQDAATLQKADAPPNGVWLDSLDLSKAPIRRGRGQRGSTAPPPPLVFKLGGVTYPHALPIVSDGDLTVDLGGAATKFMAMVGIDDGAPPAGGGPPGAAPAPPPVAGSVVFGAWVDGKK